ncbi:MAG: AmmeMemoRadiSam system radical SAM enzyme [Candidatus Omnitrophica bacterium]|nr:AmmeMemoRadiSam system radical SAM enzyme [Candidatus Omnitrophota bacterium]
MPEETIGDVLAEHTKEGELYEKLQDKAVRCFSCGHRCFIREGRPGICKVRFNEGGILRVPHGYVGALQCDPIEKKPFFHALPGSDALSFGMLGCDLHCLYCQNWFTSQSIRDPSAKGAPEFISAQELVQMAKESGAPVVASTYNEPLITSEWAVEVFKEAKKQGLRTAYISNGNGTPEVLRYLKPWVDLYKVDLKGFDDKHYRELGGQLDVVLKTIQLLYEMGFWLEIVTLVVPGFNDSDEELKKIAKFLAGVSKSIPWHVTAFHQDYKMTNRPNTQVKALLRAAELGRSEGLEFIYAGNLPGQVGEWEDTRCPGCRTTLIRRIGFEVRENRLMDGSCPRCHQKIPGIWS